MGDARLFHLSSWNRLCAPLLLLLLILASSASAQDSPSGSGGLRAEGPFDITADSIEYERERSLYIARGNVLITQPGRSLTADWVAFSDETRLGVATGDVILSEADDTLYSDVLSFEVDTLKGIAFEGSLDAQGSGFEMTGETIRKTGEETYTLDDCTFTTCRCPQEEVDPWEIRAKKADIEVGGYATTRNTTFNILGVPVLWLPWMRYPVKTERETGFLLPSISTSTRSGGEFGLPFFWAALPNLNVTITPSYLLDRGFKPSLDIEYVFGERSYGTLYGTFIDDKDVDEDDSDTPFDSKRWGVEWLHDHLLPRGWRAKVDARAVSDNLFPYDFSDFGTYQNDRYLESVGFAEKRFGPLERYGFTSGIRWADDLQNPDDQDRDRFLLQRLPDLQLAGLPQPLAGLGSRLYASFGTDYTHFYSRKKASDRYPNDPDDTEPDYVEGDDLFVDTGIDALINEEECDPKSRDCPLLVPVDPDEPVNCDEEPEKCVFKDINNDDFDRTQGKFGPENDGEFQEGELLGDRGHRLVLNPRVGIPFRIADLVEVLPEFGYHGTFYTTATRRARMREASSRRCWIPASGCVESWVFPSAGEGRST
jgi:lipopolysaccharide assembly outer membrane protein LptD (OstA)